MIQCGVEERVVRSMRTVAVRCFKCGKEGHKYRECPLWEKKAKKMAHPDRGKAHQEERRPVQEGEKRLRRMEEEKAVHPIKGKAQQEWRRSSIEELRKRVEEHCGKGVLEEAQLLEIGWMTKEIVVLYLTFKCDIMPYNNLGNISDICHGNNQNHWLERRVRPPRSVP